MFYSYSADSKDAENQNPCRDVKFYVFTFFSTRCLKGAFRLPLTHIFEKLACSLSVILGAFAENTGRLVIQEVIIETFYQS